MIAPEGSLLEKSSKGQTQNFKLTQLRNPRTGKGSLYGLSAKDDLVSVFEVQRASNEKGGSLFIDDDVISDGSIAIMTPIDPLFLVFPSLSIANAKNSMFTTLDNIVADDREFDYSFLCSCKGFQEQLKHLCDFKESDDIIAFKLNRDKYLAWLTAKVNCIKDIIRAKGIRTTVGCASSSDFIESDMAKHEDFLRAALEIVCGYVDKETEAQLFSTFNMGHVVMNTKPVVKRDTSTCTAPAENTGSGKENDQSMYSVPLQARPKVNPKKRKTKKEEQMEKAAKRSQKMTAFFQMKT
eukprot:Nk52_evm105s914 gene=Nk52_evmTU105s914